MIREKGFLQAIKLFFKEVGFPTAFIVDPSGDQTKNEVISFFHKVSTTLRVLEKVA